MREKTKEKKFEEYGKKSLLEVVEKDATDIIIIIIISNNTL